MTGAGEFDRVLWQGATSSTRGHGARLRPAAGPILTALAILGGILFITGTIDRAGAWLVAAAFLVPVVYTAGRKVLETMEPQRYTLTERRFIVESGNGRHAYGLALLGYLKVDPHEDGTGDISYRRPWDSSPPMPTVAYDEDEMTWSFRRLRLAHDVPDATTVLQRIATARHEYLKADPVPADEAATTTDAPAAAISDQPRQTSADARVPSAGVPRLLEPWVADVHPALGLFLAVTGLGIILVDVWAGGPTILSLLPAAFVVGGLFLAFQSMRARRRSRQLRREGAVTRGTIVGHLRGRRRGVAVYEYRLPDGRELTGRTRSIPFGELERWAIGDEIDVRYDAANPQENTALDRA